MSNWKKKQAKERARLLEIKMLTIEQRIDGKRSSGQTPYFRQSKKYHTLKRALAGLRTKRQRPQEAVDELDREYVGDGSNPNVPRW